MRHADRTAARRMSDDPARNRWLAMMAVRLVGTAGAVFGVILAGKATEWPVQVLGVAVVLAALWMTATVPRALARRWRTHRDLDRR